jgi:PhnB protein
MNGIPLDTDIVGLHENKAHAGPINPQGAITMTRAIPEGYGSVTPMLVFKDSRKAIDFYQRAFGARENYVMAGPDGKGVMHAEIRIGNSIIMLGDEHPHNPCRSAETLGCSPASFYLYLENVDEAFNKAVSAGATVQMAVEDTFWGDRMGAVLDPFGYSWSLATHARDMTQEEIQQEAQAFFARMA